MLAKKYHFSFCECELWPMTLTFELDLDMVKLNVSEMTYFVSGGT